MRPLRRTVLLCALLTLLAAPLRPVRAGAEPLPPPGPVLDLAVQTARAVQPAQLRASVLIRVAQACADAGRPDQAQQALAYARDAALTPLGRANAAPLAVGKAYVKLGFPADALKVAAQLPLSGDRLDLTIAAADAFAVAGDRAGADAALQAAMAAYTPSVDPVLAAQALTAAAGRGDAASAAPLLQQAVQLASSMAPRDRAAALAAVSAAYSRLGDDAAALRLAQQIDQPAARASATAATAVDLAARDEAAAVARVKRASADARRADAAELSLSFSGAARQASDAGSRALARALLDAARQAGAQASGDTRQTLLRNVANLYGTLLGDWAEALTTAEGSGDDFAVRTARAQLVIQLAAAGQAGRAAPLFEAAAADKVGFIGQKLLDGLAAAYFQLHTSADVDQAMAVEPQELRDHVLAEGARRALAAGDPAAAIGWSLRIVYSGVAEQVLLQSALARVQQADAAGLAKAVQDARRALAAVRSDRRRREVLFAIADRYLAAGDKAGVERIIAEADKTDPAEQEDCGAITRMAILEQRLGRPEEARRQMARALSVAKEITCGTCRDSALADTLKLLLVQEDAVLLQQAVDDGTINALPAQPAIELLDGLPDLPPERGRTVLRIALKAAGAERMHTFAADDLARVAIAYHKRGLTPEAPALALLPAPPAPAVDVDGPAPRRRRRWPGRPRLLQPHRLRRVPGRERDARPRRRLARPE